MTGVTFFLIKLLKTNCWFFITRGPGYPERDTQRVRVQRNTGRGIRRQIIVRQPQVQRRSLRDSSIRLSMSDLFSLIQLLIFCLLPNYQDVFNPFLQCETSLLQMFLYLVLSFQVPLFSNESSPIPREVLDSWVWGLISRPSSTSQCQGGNT